jgi:hypothetical protein
MSKGHLFHFVLFDPQEEFPKSNGDEAYWRSSKAITLDEAEEEIHKACGRVKFVEKIK